MHNSRKGESTPVKHSSMGLRSDSAIRGNANDILGTPIEIIPSKIVYQLIIAINRQTLLVI
jgi:hypothetical protein